MSTDSTELTFVRCPSCRSLVPAISTRCRMCGAGLEASATPPPAPNTGDQETRRSGRVRQRTMSESGSPLDSAAQQVRESDEPVMQASESKGAEAATNVDDPLSGYMEDVDVGGAANGSVSTNGDSHEEAETQTPAAESVAHVDKDESELLDEELDALEEELAEELSAFDDLDDELEEEVEVKPKVVVESGPRKPGRESQLSFGRRDEPKAPEKAAVEASKIEASVAKEEKTGFPSVRNDSGQKATNWGRGNKEDEGKEEQRVDSQQTHQGKPGGQKDQQRGGGDTRHGDQRKPGGGDQRQSNSRTDIPRHDQSRHEQKGHDQRGQRGGEQPRHERQQDVRPQTSPPAAKPVSAGVRVESAVAGRLFGWLVSFSDPTGRAVELREGKFFVSGKGLKPTDMVIDDKSVSTPHAMVTVSAQGGLIVQDLMSERGVFVRRRGGDPYSKEDEPITLAHGDWVRFGDVEYLVSVIAHVGEV